MKELLEGVEKLADAEKIRANGLHDAKFHTPHEAYAVMLEEYQEAQEELNLASQALNDVWSYVRHDNQSTSYYGALGRLKCAALHSAEESCQLAAMAQKEIDGQKKYE
jgi:hypothetical protein